MQAGAEALAYDLGLAAQLCVPRIRCALGLVFGRHYFRASKCTQTHNFITARDVLGAKPSPDTYALGAQGPRRPGTSINSAMFGLQQDFTKAVAQRCPASLSATDTRIHERQHTLTCHPADPVNISSSFLFNLEGATLSPGHLLGNLLMLWVPTATPSTTCCSMPSTMQKAKADDGTLQTRYNLLETG